MSSRRFFLIPVFGLLLSSFLSLPVKAEETPPETPPVVFSVTKNVNGKSEILDSKNPVVNLHDTITVSVADTTHPSGVDFVKTKWNFLNEKKRMSIPSISIKDVRFEVLKVGFIQVEADVVAMDGTKMFNKLTLEVRDSKWSETPFGHIPFVTAEKNFVFYKAFKTDENTSRDLKINFDIKNNGNVYITPYQSNDVTLQNDTITLAYQHESDPIKTKKLKINQTFRVPSSEGGFVFQLYANRQKSKERFLSEVYILDLPEKNTFSKDTALQKKVEILHNYGVSSQPLLSELFYLSTRYFKTIQTSE